MRVSVSSRGDLARTKNFLKKMSKGDLFRNLDALAKKGVAALSAATPVNSSMTANAWGYEIKIGRRSSSIKFTNDHTDNGFPVAIMLQYGHGTGTGGWVQGRDYINPSVQPVFDQIAEQAWKVVISA